MYNNIVRASIINNLKLNKNRINYLNALVNKSITTTTSNFYLNSNQTASSNSTLSHRQVLKFSDQHEEHNKRHYKNFGHKPIPPTNYSIIFQSTLLFVFIATAIDLKG